MLVFLLLKALGLEAWRIVTNVLASTVGAGLT